MAKQQKSKTQPSSSKTVKAGGYKDRDLCKVNPLKEQFEPSGAEPVRQHFKMAGGA